jgi:hypothetical protein
VICIVFIKFCWGRVTPTTPRSSAPAYASITADFVVDAWSLVNLNGPGHATLLGDTRAAPRLGAAVAAADYTPEQRLWWHAAVYVAVHVPRPVVVSDDRNGVVTGLGVVSALWLLQILLLERGVPPKVRCLYCLMEIHIYIYIERERCSLPKTLV